MTAELNMRKPSSMRPSWTPWRPIKH